MVKLDRDGCRQRPSIIKIYRDGYRQGPSIVKIDRDGYRIDRDCCRQGPSIVRSDRDDCRQGPSIVRIEGDDHGQRPPILRHSAFASPTRCDKSIDELADYQAITPIKGIYPVNPVAAAIDALVAPHALPTPISGEQ